MNNFNRIRAAAQRKGGQLTQQEIAAAISPEARKLEAEAEAELEALEVRAKAFNKLRTAAISSAALEAKEAAKEEA